MDANLARIFAGMLADVGITVTEQSLLPDPLPRDLQASITPPSSPSDYDPIPHMIPSFVHLSHTTFRSRIPYKRTTYFAAHLAQITGRLGLEGLPQGIIRRLRRSGVKPMEPTAYFRCRRLLKRWGYSSPEYRRIFAILKAMGGPVVSLSYGRETAIKEDFEHLCQLFEQRRPLGVQRKNFLSYYLVIQFLLKKYQIPQYYVLPSIKDTTKFTLLCQAYSSMTGVL